MYKNSKLRALLIVPVLLLLLVSTVQPVFATEFPQDGIIGADEVIDDDVILGSDNPTVLGTVNGMLIVAGNHIFIDGTINGDVIAMGNYVEIGENATIHGNIFSGAYLVNLAGTVDGSFFGGAYTIHVADTADISRNMYAGGFAINVEPEATIATDAMLGAYQATLHGKIGRDLKVGSGALLIDGSIGRNANIDVESPMTSESISMYMMPYYQQNDALPAEASQYIPTQMDPGLTITDSAEIGGKITYVSPQPQEDSIMIAPQGGIVYQTPVPDPDNHEYEQQQTIVFQDSEQGTFGFFAGMALTWIWRIIKAFITLALIALLVFWLFPGKFDESVEALKNKPLPSFGYGLLATIGGGIILGFAFLVLICVTAFLIVISFGELGSYFFLIAFSAFFIVLAVFMILTNLVSKILVAYLVGRWLINTLSKEPISGRTWPLIVGLILYLIVGYMPFIGWFLRYLMTLFGSGAIYLVLRDWMRSRKQPAIEAVETNA
jgi:cytoskeletal protein CcmA (bactofilin family)